MQYASASTVDTALLPIAISVSYAFHNKENPSGNTGKFGSDWPQVNWSQEQIAEHQLRGKAICVAAMQNDHRKRENFISSQLMCLDLDDGPDVETLSQHPFIAEHAFLIYASPRSTPDSPRTRALFMLDQAISDADTYERYVKRLLVHLDKQGVKADPACKDAARMFYGSENAECAFFEGNLLPVSVLEAMLEADSSVPKARRCRKERQRKPEAETPANLSQKEERLMEKIRQVLQLMPKRLLYADWLRILMAVYDAFPNAIGIQLIEEWSPGEPGEVADKWRSFGRDHANPVTIKTLWYMAAQYATTDGDALPADHTVNCRYLTEASFPPERVMLIKSPLGTGKTEYARRLIERLDQKAGQPARVLVVTHRRALCSDISRRTGLQNYQDLQRTDLKRAKRLVITTNSLKKLRDGRGHLPTFDLVIIDEIEENLKHLLGKTFSGNQGVAARNILQSLIQTAGHVLAMDAYATVRARDFLNEARSEADVRVIINTYQPALIPLSLYSRRDELMTAFDGRLAYATKPIVVFCDTRARAEALAAWLEENRISSYRVVHGGNSQNPEVRAFLANIDQHLPRLRILICSPSVGVGVDIQTEVDSVFGFFSGQTLCAEELMQMLGRCRNAPRVHVWLGRYVNDFNADPDSLRDSAMRAYIKTHAACSYVGNVPQLTDDLNAYLNHYATVTAARNRSRNLLLITFLALAKQRFEITEETAECGKLDEEVNKAHQAAKAEEKERILIADLVDETTYVNLRDSGELTPEHEAGYKRWQMESALGTPVTAAIIDAWRNGKLLRQVDQFIALYQPRQDMIALDRQEEADAVAIQSRSHYALCRQTLRALLGSVFDDRVHTEILTDAELKAKLAGRFAANVKKYEDILYGPLGRRRSQDAGLQLLLRHTLRCIGLTLSTIRHGKRKKNYTYQLDPDQYQWMKSLAKARAEHLGLKVNWAQSLLDD